MATFDVNRWLAIRGEMKKRWMTDEQVNQWYEAYRSGGDQWFKTFYQGIKNPTQWGVWSWKVASQSWLNLSQNQQFETKANVPSAPKYDAKMLTPNQQNEIRNMMRTWDIDWARTKAKSYIDQMNANKAKSAANSTEFFTPANVADTWAISMVMWKWRRTENKNPWVRLNQNQWQPTSSNRQPPAQAWVPNPIPWNVPLGNTPWNIFPQEMAATIGWMEQTTAAYNQRWDRMLREAGREQQEIVERSNEPIRTWYEDVRTKNKKTEEEYREAAEQGKKDAEELLRVQHDVAERQSRVAMWKASSGWLLLPQSQLDAVRSDALAAFGSNIATAMDFRNKTNQTWAEWIKNTALAVWKHESEIINYLSTLNAAERQPMIQAIALAANNNVNGINAIRDAINAAQKAKFDEEQGRMLRRNRMEQDSNEYSKAPKPMKKTILREVLGHPEYWYGADAWLLTDAELDDIISKSDNLIDARAEASNRIARAKAAIALQWTWNASDKIKKEAEDRVAWTPSWTPKLTTDSDGNPTVPGSAWNVTPPSTAPVEPPSETKPPEDKNEVPTKTTKFASGHILVVKDDWSFELMSPNGKIQPLPSGYFSDKKDPNKMQRMRDSYLDKPPGEWKAPEVTATPYPEEWSNYDKIMDSIWSGITYKPEWFINDNNWYDNDPTFNLLSNSWIPKDKIFKLMESTSTKTWMDSIKDMKEDLAKLDTNTRNKIKKRLENFLREKFSKK